MNPFSPSSNDGSDESSVEPNFGDKITISCVVGCLNVAVFAIGGLVYYFFGWTGMHVVFIGGPLALILNLYWASKYPYQTSEASGWNVDVTDATCEIAFLTAVLMKGAHRCSC